MTLILVHEGSCSRCGEEVTLRQITDDSKLYAWCARARTKDRPNPSQCWAADGRPMGRLHHVEGYPQMLEAVIAP